MTDTAKKELSYNCPRHGLDANCTCPDSGYRDALTLESEKYYAVCISLSKSRGWWATYHAIQEDGFDPKVDWKALHEKWSGGKGQKGSE